MPTPSVQDAMRSAQSLGSPASITLTGFNVTATSSTTRLFVFGMFDANDDRNPVITSTVDTLSVVAEVVTVADTNQGTILYEVVNPATSTRNFTMSCDVGTDMWMGAICFKDVDSRGTAFTDGGADTSTSVTVTGVNSTDLLFGVGSCNAGQTITFGANQTSLLELAAGAGGGATLFASTQSGADGGVMSYSWPSSGRSANIAFALVATGSGGSTVKTLAALGVG